jgi:hypothetical protein
LFLECKAPAQEPTPAATHRLEALRELGYRAVWVDNADAARRAILEAMDAAAVHAARGGLAPKTATPAGLPLRPGGRKTSITLEAFRQLAN